MKILVSGFDPFGGEKVNPAIEAVKLLSDEIKGDEVIRIEISTVIGKSIDKLKEKIAEVKPDVVISVNQAGGREDVTIERVAINVDDCRTKDNEGNQSIGEKIAEDGLGTYLLTLPIKTMVENIRSINILASVSNTAGTFICDYVAHGTAHARATEYPNMRTGLIHIPFLPEQVLNKLHTASMNLDTITKTLEKAIEAVIDNDEGTKVTGGKTH